MRLGMVKIWMLKMNKRMKVKVSKPGDERTSEPPAIRRTMVAVKLDGVLEVVEKAHKLCRLHFLPILIGTFLPNTAR
jgi:hypothetical protein